MVPVFFLPCRDITIHQPFYFFVFLFLQFSLIVGFFDCSGSLGVVFLKRKVTITLEGTQNKYNLNTNTGKVCIKHNNGEKCVSNTTLGKLQEMGQNTYIWNFLSA